MKKTLKKIPAVGIVVVLLIMSITAQATIHNHEADEQQNLAFNENIVAEISLSWDSFLRNFSLKALNPIVTINQSSTTDYYFPEINGSIPKINFTVNCKHQLLYRVLLPRSTQVYLAIQYNDSYIFLQESEKHRCTTEEWEYINFTAESDESFEPLLTNGENITLTLEVGAYGFFFGLRGEIRFLEPITIHPIPS